VDLKAKNRASLVNYPVIRDMRWLPDSNDFLFLARPTNDTAETVFVYRWDEGKTYQLDLKTSLDDIAIIDRNHILAITSQKLPDRINNQPWDGQIVPLGENQSTAEVSDNTGLTGAGDSADSTAQTASYNAPTYAFVDFSLIANQARLISTLTQNPFPTKIKAEQDNKGLYFLQGDQVSELRFQE